jgi:hypothetical protein
LTDDAPVWVENPTDEEVHRGELIEAGIDGYIRGRSRTVGRKAANNRARYERQLRANRERERECEYARRWREYHERQAELHESLAAEHRRKALDLVGRA